MNSDVPVPCVFREHWGEYCEERSREPLLTILKAVFVSTITLIMWVNS